MLILDDRSEAVIIDNIYVPTVSDSFWTLNLEIMDFTLADIVVLEELVCPTITLAVRGFEFVLPANWNVLVYDEDTMQLDVVEVSDLAGRDFVALVYGPNTSSVIPGRIKVLDYNPSGTNVYPALNKHQMLCHPIDPILWIAVAPSDSYNKYLKDCVVGDII